MAEPKKVSTPLKFALCVVVALTSFMFLVSMFGPKFTAKVRNITATEKWGPLGVTFIPSEKRNIRFSYDILIENVHQADWENGYPKFSAGTGTEVVYVYKSGGVCILTNDYTKAVEYFNRHASGWLFPVKNLPGEPK